MHGSELSRIRHTVKGWNSVTLIKRERERERVEIFKKMESSNISIHVSCIWLKRTSICVRCVSTAYKEAKVELTSRFRQRRDMFHFRRPEMAVKFEKEWAQILASGKKLDAARQRRWWQSWWTERRGFAGVEAGVVALQRVSVFALVLCWW